jgi:hypothetical protein
MTRTPLHKLIAAILAVSVIAAGMPLRARSQSVSIPRGTATSDAAALPSPGVTSSGSTTLPLQDGAADLLRFGALGFAAEPDSTEDEFEFPDEEKSHLARDITVFVIASVFVAFFIVKVFLEGDTDTPDDSGGGGKQIP